MNKYKIVSLVLLVALLAVSVRLAMMLTNGGGEDRAAVVKANILSRKSVRSFTDEAVLRADLDTLVRLAMAAPTGKDMRPWQFVVIDDASVLKKLSEALPKMAPLTQAKAAIVVCGDSTVTDKDGRPSGAWMLDCSAATENALLAAEAMGLGAVWLGVYPYGDRVPTVQRTLALPEKIIPLNIIAIGHPNGASKPKDKYDAAKVHYNGW